MATCNVVAKYKKYVVLFFPNRGSTLDVVVQLIFSTVDYFGDRMHLQRRRHIHSMVVVLIIMFNKSIIRTLISSKTWSSWNVRNLSRKRDPPSRTKWREYCKNPSQSRVVVLPVVEARRTGHRSSVPPFCLCPTTPPTSTSIAGRASRRP